MTFNSFLYFLFLPVVYLFFRLVPDRWRWLVLLAASYLFYAALKAPYLLAVLAAVTMASYTGARLIESADGEAGRWRRFLAGNGFCLLLLALLKYLPFSHLSAGTTPAIISIGVSYFSFQAISYLADVYLEIDPAERHFGRYALYLAFFPKLLQGPIERGGALLPQLREPYRPDYVAIRAGLLRFGWGLFKKVVVADRLSLMVNAVYDHPHAYSGLSLLAATYLYALQIYFDFSGYTDMALGTARCFNITLTENFNGPYLATSVSDFWRRWHISFSRWILDYLFKPLQLRWRDAKKAGTAAALLITFLVSGIWHGASWGFVIWGALHGTYLAASVFYQPWKKKVQRMLHLERSPFLSWWQRFFTFHLVCFAWIFFRANSVGDAWYIAGHLFQGGGPDPVGILFTSGKISLLVLVFALATILAVALVTARTAVRERFFERPCWFRWLAYYALAMMLLVFGIDSENLFVYFKF